MSQWHTLETHEVIRQHGTDALRGLNTDEADRRLIQHGPNQLVERGRKVYHGLATCQSCHGDKPHKESLLQAGRLNAHTDTLACQACHIPSFARGGVPTKMGWDWSTAGKLTDAGKPFQKKDDKGHVIYDSKKGDFVLTIDPSRTHGRELRVVIEAKDRSLSRRVLAEELTAARGNRERPSPWRCSRPSTLRRA